jgi:predicted acyl esterase
VKVPVYAVGGYADGYTNPIFRMMENLSGPRKALVGPWAHKYPHFATPGPADRVLAGMPALVGSTPQGHRHRHHGRADDPRLDSRRYAPDTRARPSARTLGD